MTGFAKTNTIRTFAAAAVLVSIVSSANAQSADERTIRDLIARYDRGESVAQAGDMIYWTGPFKRPTVGSEERDPLPPELQPTAARSPGAPSERVPGSRRRVTTPIRIEIADSGDLAYEFSHSELVFDLENGDQEAAIPASVLRVWKKGDGEWSIAALFAHPHYQDAAPPDQN